MTGARVIVSGGTGTLGRAVVARLVGEGARVAVPFRGDAGWTTLRAEETSERLWGATADIADPQRAMDFVEAATRWLGGLDGVACLAGAWAGGRPLEAAPSEEWAAMQRANVDSVRALCSAALPAMTGEGGAVVTVSSRLAALGGPGSAAYAASKAAVESLTRSLALENLERRVRFNCVVPRTIDTPANRLAMPTVDPAGWTSPHAIARVITFLLSPESACITGAVIPVDGPAS